MSRWQQYFEEEPELALIAHSKCVVRATALFEAHQCKNLLDLACGAGRESRYLANRFPFVASLDYSLSALTLAKAKGTENLLRSDARKLPFRSQCFDAVYCYGLLHEFCPPEGASNVLRVMAEIRRVLRKDGVLILAALEGDPVNGDPDIPQVQLFSDTMFFDAATGFNCLEYKEYDDLSCTGNSYYHIHYGAFTNGPRPD